MAFHFPLMPRMFMAIAKGNATAMINILDKTPEIPAGCQWCTFLRNHDELTVEMVTEEERQFLWDFYAPEPRMRLNLGIRRRLAPLLGGDSHKIELLYAIMLSLPGVPIIYFGDEIGMGDNIFLNDREGVRTPMQWSKQNNAGFSERADGKLFLPVIDQGKYGYSTVNVEAQRKDPDSLFNRLCRLIAVRKAHAAFSSQDLEILYRNRPSIFAVCREETGGKIICIHNLSSQVQKIELSGKRCELLHHSMNQPLAQIKLEGGEIQLEPYAYVWLNNCQ
jgi:maltose alpha-D-glucosyltransferase/alpha-amylase